MARSSGSLVPYAHRDSGLAPAGRAACLRSEVHREEPKTGAHHVERDRESAGNGQAALSLRPGGLRLA